MVQGYYTLQEAAQVLGMPPEELKQMAQKNQIRSFQDRGTWRFRVQDIQELARQRGAASDLELILGEGGVPRSSDSPIPKSPKSNPPKSSAPKSPQPKSGPKSPGAKTPTKVSTPDVFDFVLDPGGEHVGVGREILGETPSGRKAGSKSGGKHDSKKGPPTPVVTPGSDSDVRLVSENSDLDFVFDGPNQGAPDSNVKLLPSDSKKPPESPRPPKTPRKSVLAPESPVPKKVSKLATPHGDSGVRLVPMDSDSDVKIVGAGSDEISLGDMPPKSATDSDIRLEPVVPMPPGSEEGMLTEEINLDEELRKQEALSQQKPQAKVKPKSKLPKFPSVSPFELSESQLKLPADQPAAKAKPDSSDFDLTPGGAKADSSDFDLTPAKKEDSSDFDLATGKGSDSSSDDFSLELPDDVGLDPGSSNEGALKGPSSGISLNNPADSGISLEQGGEGSDEIEFELSLDAEATPKPAAQQPSGDSSEFELSLDVDDSQVKASSPSDSEFELTLDDSGGLSMDDQAPQLKAGEEKDIFETDFEVPALEEESGSQVAALDTDLDSSDFDLALGDSDIAAEEESGSQVVALDEEEEADDAAATVAGKRPDAMEALEGEEDLGFGQLDEDEPAAEAAVEAEAEDEDGPTRPIYREKAAKAAPWGVVPVLVMLPCVVVMVLVGLMGLELVQHMTGYKPPGFLTKTLSELMGQKPK